MKLGLIMLAAGNSRRFGSNKLLYTIEGEPMYRHILSELMKVREVLKEQGHSCEITVVTQYEEIAAEAEKCGIFFSENRTQEKSRDGCLPVYGV